LNSWRALEAQGSGRASTNRPENHRFDLTTLPNVQEIGRGGKRKAPST
jgi:hypothetical protein